MFEQLTSLLSSLYDVKSLITWGGLFLICAIVFMETGLFVGFFLPGDSLLFTAGVFAAAGYLPIFWLLIGATLCAIVGDQVGYLIGRHMGRRLFTKEDGLLFKRKHLNKAKEFYDEHGSKTIVIARFMPIVRTFAPRVAGATHMDYKRFITYNVVGGVLWVWSLVLGAYFLSSLIPNLEHYLHYIILVIVALSVAPIAYHVIREYLREKRS
jgi:membrane-associated protein